MNIRFKYITLILLCSPFGLAQASLSDYSPGKFKESDYKQCVILEKDNHERVGKLGHEIRNLEQSLDNELINGINAEFGFSLETRADSLSFFSLKNTTNKSSIVVRNGIESNFITYSYEGKSFFIPLADSDHYTRVSNLSIDKNDLDRMLKDIDWNDFSENATLLKIGSCNLKTTNNGFKLRKEYKKEGGYKEEIKIDLWNHLARGDCFNSDNVESGKIAFYKDVFSYLGLERDNPNENIQILDEASLPTEVQENLFLRINDIVKVQRILLGLKEELKKFNPDFRERASKCINKHYIDYSNDTKNFRNELEIGQYEKEAKSIEQLEEFVISTFRAFNFLN